MMYNSECDMWHGAIHKRFAERTEQFINEYCDAKLTVERTLRWFSGESFNEEERLLFWKVAESEILDKLIQSQDNYFKQFKEGYL